MKHFKQGDQECFPTSIAMYLEREPRQVMKEILAPELDCYQWSYLASMLLTDLGLKFKDKVLNYVQETLPWLDTKAFCIEPDEPVLISAWPEQLPLTQGFITQTALTFDPNIGTSVMRGRHIVAFDGPLVYDSNLDFPVPYILYEAYKFSGDWFVDGIYTSKARTNR